MNEKYQPSLEEIGEDHEQALGFNQILDSGKISKEYVQAIRKEQSVEETTEIVENAEALLQDINSYGTLYHYFRNVNADRLQEILRDGLFSRHELQYMGKKSADEIGQTSAINISLFQEWISLSMVLEPSSDDVAVPGKTIEAGAIGRCVVIVNPKYIEELIERRPSTEDSHITRRGEDRRVAFGGRNFRDRETLRKFKEFVKENGWLNACRTNDGHEDDTEDDFVDKYVQGVEKTYAREPGEHWPDEVVIRPQRGIDGRYNNRMISGVVVNGLLSAEVIKWLDEIATDHPELAVPVYDKMGNVIWPIKIARDDIDKFIGSQNDAEGSETRKLKAMEMDRIMSFQGEHFKEYSRDRKYVPIFEPSEKNWGDSQTFNYCLTLSEFYISVDNYLGGLWCYPNYPLAKLGKADLAQINQARNAINELDPKQKWPLLKNNFYKYPDNDDGKIYHFEIRLLPLTEEMIASPEYFDTFEIVDIEQPADSRINEEYIREYIKKRLEKGRDEEKKIFGVE